ncbi:ficolin-1 [Elysia marginata]|uniref:Ficolin-1 n=1 Tax=Elysia marginata TaxID=1093978 RepID=A0AAV4F340_9GAST|nr:ficolin-1 [Elysia marginata]
MTLDGRAKGDIGFDKTWSEYKNGFGVPPGDFWLGNDAIHALTTKNAYELRIDLRNRRKYLFAQYSLFKVEDEKNSYRLHVGSSSGTLHESKYGHISGMLYNDRRKFSTKDRDNDPFSGSCSTLLHGGWWYGTRKDKATPYHQHYNVVMKAFLVVPNASPYHRKR